jgi:hypothetical protein
MCSAPSRIGGKLSSQPVDGTILRAYFGPVKVPVSRIDNIAID